MKASLLAHPTRFAAPALVLLATGMAGGSSTPQGQGREAVRPEAGEYTAHEWGTFTSVLDSQGRALSWNPFGFFAPLPGFVHVRQDRKQSYWGTVRMETPVVYVYTERELTLHARVGFPSGVLTEWYPSADATDASVLAWSGLEALPGLETLLPTSLAGEHYYAARGVAATHLRGRSGETEKFLFYRGVGSFEQPLSVRALGEGDERAFLLENRGAEPIEQVMLFENRAGRSALLELSGLAPGESRRVARTELVLGDDLSLVPLERLLRAHGLFEDEAQAMLATWRRDWFEPGLRAFYVLPRAQTDAILPLTLTPAPASLERVLVGRLELIEPELERTILDAARAVAAGTKPEVAFARAAATSRFALAVLQGRYESEPSLMAAEQPLIAWLKARAESGNPR